MKKKILDCCITDVLVDINSAKGVNIYVGGLFLLMSMYSLLAYFVSTSNGISYEESLNVINTIIGASTLFPIAILFSELRSALNEKQVLLKNATVLEDIKKDLGLSKITKVSVSRNKEESTSRGEVFDVMLKDRQGRVAYLKEVKSYLESECKTYLSEDTSKDIKVRSLYKGK